MVRGRPLVHARSDLAAAAAVLGRPQAWVWDVRSFWVDQRLAMGLVGRGSIQERALRAVETSAARRATAITTLTAAAIDVMAERHGERIRAKSAVIPTCVDLDRFCAAPMPDSGRIQLLLSGSFNALYDLDLTLRFLEAMRRVRPSDLTLVRPDPSAWDHPVGAAGGTVTTASFDDMPGRVRASHAGLSICRTDDRAAIAGAAPTKLAEFLASGRPVVVNAGLGDMDDLIARYECGVVLGDTSERGLGEAALRLGTLVDDERTPLRCRAAAAENFDLEKGISKLLEVYVGTRGKSSVRPHRGET